jgi:hypothetical protein
MDEFTFQNDCLILGKTLSRQFYRFVNGPESHWREPAFERVRGTICAISLADWFIDEREASS